jgi:hypothetical protein
MENFVSEKVSREAANDDEAQKSIIWTTSNKLTGNLVWSSSVKQSKAFQPRFLQYSDGILNETQCR